MKISRRKFLGAAPLAVLSTGLILQLDKSVSAANGGKKGVGNDTDELLGRLTWDSFYPYVTTDFTFRDESGKAVNLNLAKMIDTRNPKKNSGKGECFSLTFIGGRHGQLVHDTYQVEHFALGNFPLMVTFLGKNGKNFIYEVIINRLDV